MADAFTDSQGVLLNKLGITDAFTLSKAEANIAWASVEDLKQRGGVPGGKFDRDHFQQIHRFTFGDIYPWAGETRAARQFQGHKPTYATGNREIMVFAPYPDIDGNLEALARQLEKENYLKGLPLDRFIDRAAFYLDQYNYTHPFREGNGRSLQGAFTQLALQAGYSLDFNQLKNKEDYNHGRDLAMVRVHGAPGRDLEGLRNMLRTVTGPVPTQEGERLRRTPAAPTAPLPPELLRMEAKREFDVTFLRLTEVYPALRGMEPIDAFLQRFHAVRFDGKQITRHKDAFQTVIQAIVNHPGVAPASQDFQDAKRFGQSILQLEKIAQGQILGEEPTQKPKGPRLG
ncbi:Fic/DOC family protein [Rufibacter sediminis]|uniref:protein adenylyltransferase n=1 Tax=Rufibacter sediminis TaxID=2762756 RepID=A0ABR6VP36_9BACT|nr:Fic family protein [Rufibacter sediminis]MBC3538954.1 Fic family protein [Rufibacter sediminis]